VFYTLRVHEQEDSSRHFVEVLGNEASTIDERISALQGLLKVHFLQLFPFFTRTNDCHVIEFYQYSSFEENGNLRRLQLLTKTGSYIQYWIRICAAYEADAA
jgi:hypothetical protein